LPQQLHPQLQSQNVEPYQQPLPQQLGHASYDDDDSGEEDIGTVAGEEL
jgi:hypothetical protein